MGGTGCAAGQEHQCVPDLITECCNVSLAEVMTISPMSEALVPVNVFSSSGAGFPTTCIEKARWACFWSFMLRDIRQWCGQCRACQIHRSPVPMTEIPGHPPTSTGSHRYSEAACNIAGEQVRFGGGGLFHEVC